MVRGAIHSSAELGSEPYMVEAGNNEHIGTNAVIMTGVCIGDNAIVGCGAAATKDIADRSVAVGVPARVIENVDEFIEKNSSDFVHTKNLDYSRKREFLKKYGL